MPRLTVPHCARRHLSEGQQPDSKHTRCKSNSLLTCHDHRDGCYPSQCQVCRQSKGLHTPQQALNDWEVSHVSSHMPCDGFKTCLGGL